jgi:hypothetical protein
MRQHDFHYTHCHLSHLREHGNIFSMSSLHIVIYLED